MKIIVSLIKALLSLFFCIAQLDAGAKSNSNPPLFASPILVLGERNPKIPSNPSLITFLTIGGLSSASSDLLHPGAPVWTLIRVEEQPSPLPAPARTPFSLGMLLPGVSIHFFAIDVVDLG